MKLTRAGLKMAAVVCGLLAFAQVAGAANGTWYGTTDGTWATGSNWSSGSAPGRPDTAIFNGAGNGNTAIGVGTGVVVSNLIFDTGAAAYSTEAGACRQQTHSP